MAIDVFFTGLMLICLEGQPSCPVNYRPNTAWVVQADWNKSTPCGWQHSKEVTTLELRFLTDQFNFIQSRPANCHKDDLDSTMTQCDLPTRKITDVCVDPIGSKAQQLDPSLQLVPRLDEVDGRFKALDMELLKNLDFVPTQIHFSKGKIGAGPKWMRNNMATLWYRSDGDAGGALPRELSDRLRVTYGDTRSLNINDCEGAPLITLTAKSGNAMVVFRNRADVIVPDVVNGYDNLAYLLWYYRLGLWATDSKRCPEYTDNNKDAVLLRCARVGDHPCSSFDFARDTVHWPPMLAPWK